MQQPKLTVCAALPYITGKVAPYFFQLHTTLCGCFSDQRVPGCTQRRVGTVSEVSHEAERVGMQRASRLGEMIWMQPKQSPGVVFQSVLPGVLTNFLLATFFFLLTYSASPQDASWFQNMELGGLRHVQPLGIQNPHPILPQQHISLGGQKGFSLSTPKCEWIRELTVRPLQEQEELPCCQGS